MWVTNLQEAQYKFHILPILYLLEPQQRVFNKTIYSATSWWHHSHCRMQHKTLGVLSLCSPNNPSLINETTPTTFIQVEVILITEFLWATCNENIIFSKKVLKTGDLVKMQMFLLVPVQKQVGYVICSLPIDTEHNIPGVLLPWKTWDPKIKK